MLTKLFPTRPMLATSLRFSFAEDNNDGGDRKRGPPKLTEDTVSQLKRRFVG